VIGVEGLARAIAVAPDYELLSFPEPRPKAAEMQAILLGTDVEKLE